MSRELCAYVVRPGALSFWGSGDAAVFEQLAEQHFEALLALDQAGGRPDGSAEHLLEEVVLQGGDPSSVQPILHLLLTAVSPPGRLRDNAWSPVQSSALDDFDAALTASGVPRNALLQKLRRPVLDGAGKILAPLELTLTLLPGSSVVTAENLWIPGRPRMERADADRVTSLVGWWSQARSQPVTHDLLLVLA